MNIHLVLPQKRDEGAQRAQVVIHGTGGRAGIQAILDIENNMLQAQILNKAHSAMFCKEAPHDGVLTVNIDRVCLHAFGSPVIGFLVTPE